MTRRRAPGNPPLPAPDAFGPVMAADQAGEADLFAGFLEALAPYDQGTVRAALYQKPIAGQGPYRWVDDLYPPFEFDVVFRDLKERFGGGDFELRALGGGKIRKSIPISIARERERPAAAAPPAANSFQEMMALMMAQQSEARRDAQAASERQMNMFLSMSESQSKLLGAVLPALAGNAGGGGKVSETVALITALQDRAAAGGGLKDTLEAMAAFKALMGDPGGGGEPAPGFDPDDLIASGARLVGPAMKALGDYVDHMRERRAGGPEQPAAAAAADGGGGDVLALGAPASRFRIINLVRTDVLYMFQRGHAPDKAADLVFDVIEANNVTPGEIDELAAKFALSPSGLDDLAAEGIDLRSRPQWAAEFFAALAAIHSGESDDFDGGEGGAPNARGNGAAGAQG